LLKTTEKKPPEETPEGKTPPEETSGQRKPPGERDFGHKKQKKINKKLSNSLKWPKITNFWPF